MKKVNVLAELLKCALFSDKIEENVKKLISENARTVYDMALRHDIAHLAEFAMKKSGIAVFDEEVSYGFLKQQVMAVMRYENISLALKEVCELFESEKIPHIPLKGAVIRKYYPEPWMRTSCDIDVLVHKEDIERAKQVVIEKLGFTTDGEWHYHDISLMRDDVHLELHFNIKENIENIDRLLERVWEHASPKCDGTYEYALDNEFLMFHTAAHMSYHFVGGGCGIRSFIDLFLLKKNLKLDEKKLFHMLEECHIKKFYELCLKLSNIWLSDEEHDETTYLMHRYLLEGGTYGSKQNSIAVKRLKKSKFYYVFERIFMPYEQLVVMYPNLKGKRILVPFYQIKRWCRRASNGRIGRSANELATSIGVSNEKSDSMAELLEKVGLINSVKKKQGR